MKAKIASSFAGAQEPPVLCEHAIDDLQSDICGSPSSGLELDSPCSARRPVHLVGTRATDCPVRAVNEPVIVTNSARKGECPAIGDRQFYDKESDSKAFMRCLLRGS